MNNVSLTGHIATDMELRKLPGEQGTAVIETRVAVRKRAKDGERDANFIDVKLYGKTAELVYKYLAKGSRIGLSGRIEVDQWTDKTSGEPRSRTYVVGEEIEFLDSRKTDDQQLAAAA